MVGVSHIDYNVCVCVTSLQAAIFDVSLKAVVDILVYIVMYKDNQ